MTRIERGPPVVEVQATAATRRTSRSSTA